jgi:hypothetical protein
VLAGVRHLFTAEENKMDSYDLEVEFQKLVASMREQVAAKVKAGTLSGTDGDSLQDMIDERLTAPRQSSRGWQRSSWCGDLADDDDGWSRSGQAC